MGLAKIWPFNKEKRSTNLQPTGLSSPESWFVDYVRTRIEASPETALSIPAFWACVNLISSDIAMLPLLPVEIDGDARYPLNDHATYELVHSSPNPESTKMDVFSTWLGHALVYPAGYLEIQRDNSGRPVSLWNLDPTSVTPKRDDHGNLYYEVKGLDRKSLPVSPENILCLHGLGFSPDLGYALSTLCSDVVSGQAGISKASAKLWENGIIPAGFLTLPSAMDPEKLQILRDDFAARHAGSRNAWKPVILESGMDYKPASINPRDAQLIEALGAGVEQIARLFRVPLYKIGHMTGTTFASVDALAVDYLQGLLPWLTRIEQELSKKLLLPHEKGRISYKHKEKALLRGDLQTQSQWYREMLMTGSMSQNEIRALEDLPPIEGGDTYWIPSTLLPLQVALSPNRPAAPAPNPNPPKDPEPDERPTQEENGEEASSALRSHFSLALRSALDKPIRVENDKAIRARKRGEGLEWASDFAGTHRDHVKTHLLGIVASYITSKAIADGKQAPSEEFLREANDAVSEAYIIRLRQDLEAGIERDSSRETDFILNHLDSYVNA